MPLCIRASGWHTGDGSKAVPKIGNYPVLDVHCQLPAPAHPFLQVVLARSDGGDHFLADLIILFEPADLQDSVSAGTLQLICDINIQGNPENAIHHTK